MEKKISEYIPIYCQNDEHYLEGELAQYIMIKQDKGPNSKRLLCNKCYFGEYSTCQEYCCDLNELLNGNIFEAFKSTKFDNQIMQMFFNYVSKLHLSLNEDYIKEVTISYNDKLLRTLRAEIESAIDELGEKLLNQAQNYKNQLQSQEFDKLCEAHFKCDELKLLFQKEFHRSPKNWAQLNEQVEKYVKQINETAINKEIEEKTTKSLEEQKLFFNLDRFSNGMKNLLQTVTQMKDQTISSYQFSKSSLATPFIDNVLEKIDQTNKEKIYKYSTRLFRLTKNGVDYQLLQKIQELNEKNTLTIIQTSNNQVFGVYNDVSQRQKSFLFHMNKGQIFQVKKDKKALDVNMNSSLQSWILNFGEGDIVVNSTFTNCSSNLNTGFDTNGTTIFNHQEYIANCLHFDIVDLEIFEIIASEPQQPIQQEQQFQNKLPPNPNQQPQKLFNQTMKFSG